MNRLLVIVISIAFIAAAATCSNGDEVESAASCLSPDLRFGDFSSHWASLEDYAKRVLTVELTIDNAGGGEARTVQLSGNDTSSGAVLATATPIDIATSLGAGVSTQLSLRYRVPEGVTSFMTTLFIQAEDACGNTHRFPGEPSGCTIFPSDNIWNTRIDSLPVDANSTAYVSTIGAGDYFHPDFGSGLWDGGPIGIPFIEVDASQPAVDISFYYPDESDRGPYPLPPDAPIEGGSDSDGDRHVLVLDTESCRLYEVFDAWPQQDGSWQAGSGAIFDLRSNVLRPDGWTSADAAGLPIYPGLVLFDEVVSGEITHAIRFTAPETRRAYVWPARHFASSLPGSQYPPMGQRLRLKADYEISGYSPKNQVILTAMKRYGIILADNGAPWYISGAPDERWDNDELRELKQLQGSDFEAVDVSSLMVDPESGQAR